MVISKITKRKIANCIEKLDSFKDTEFEMGEDEDDQYYTFEAIEMYDTIIVRSEFISDTDTCTDYFVFNGKTLRECTTIEDDYLREGDLNNCPIRDLTELEFIICKTNDNSVERFDDADKEM